MKLSFKLMLAADALIPVWTVLYLMNILLPLRVALIAAEGALFVASCLVRRKEMAVLRRGRK